MKNILITGANRGLGLEFAKQYSKNGYKLYTTARNTELCDNLKKFLITTSSI